MFRVRFADVVIEIQNQYADVERLCRAYMDDSSQISVLTVCVSDEEIGREQAASQTAVTPGYAESVCVYRHICLQMPRLCQSFVFHGVVIEYEGNGYIFTAPSGVGKTTHALLWRKRFGKDVHMINGDKPLLQIFNHTLVAHGTPWCGKEGWSENRSVPVVGICFLERSLQNCIARISVQEALPLVFRQILLPTAGEDLDILLPLVEQAVQSVPLYRLHCNRDIEAAELAYFNMKNGAVT